MSCRCRIRRTVSFSFAPSRHFSPQERTSSAATCRLPESLPREGAVNLACLISKIGDDYYWASRENKRMVRMESVAFITYVAANGSGYVRVIQPGMKQAAALMGETEAGVRVALAVPARSQTHFQPKSFMPPQGADRVRKVRSNDPS